MSLAHAETDTSVEYAIDSRKSVRAFLPDPISRDVVEDILQLSVRAPSGTNTQPWHVYACTGAIRDALVEETVAMHFAGNTGASYEGQDYYPAKWQDKHTQRRRACGWGLYDLLGIKKGEREKTHKQHARNYMFFDAPVGLFFYVDRDVARGSWFDTGMLVQTVMLAARGHGLHTCPQACWVPYHDVVAKHLDVPDDQILACGMALGYEDVSAPENKLRTAREPLEIFANFRGFD